MPQRYIIVAITAIAALWMYIDRVCFSTLAEPMKIELLLPHAPEPSAGEELTADELKTAKKRKLKKLGENPPAGAEELTPEELTAAKKKKWADTRMSFVLSAFFLTYALFQIPMGTLADRFGARKVLALSIAAWSIVTMITGFVGGFVALLGIRLLLGITEAGAYPAAAGLVKRWAKPDERGLCSSIVALGGRIGGAIAPWLTALLATGLVGYALVEWVITPNAVPVGPGEKAKNWRGVFVVYGFCGLAVAVLFWLLVRDHPPASANSEPTADADPNAKATAPIPFRKLIPVLARTRNMWLFGGVQFGVNVGWAFVVTLLPSYLAEVFETPVEQVGPMQTTALTIGLCGMACGGLFTDWLRKALGPKHGRSVPIAVALGSCVVVFTAIPSLATAWAVIIALGVMAFLVDLHNPSIWSFAQDVGGKNVGGVLGWGNMWGNLGAALSPVLLMWVKQQTNWNTAFYCCGLAFACSTLCGLLLDARKPIDSGTTA
jgi:MFS family permease